MKALFLFLLTSTFMLTSCSTDATSETAEEAEVEEEVPEEGSTPPRIGMTKAQVEAKYGTPVNVSVNSRGETWVYVFNNWDSRTLIPYYGAFHNAFKQRHSGIVHFDSNGRVRDFNWSQSNPVGGTVWR
ncbi:Outer membrane protein assembly factor BamE, lipoprotein component of the BamABCDE complex [Prosthecobacter debontii]|uniref:Outer membrane protein assembly factor BamE, lipoprotein component of the BamABCDE complex n=2 Tax=Prosthecobacter debontii TaxID=48467 RepID=A0A1T4WE74_9BACT|nr:Outer membrane protein assembly factor BamE, lipoprotein component of the BamABCDE complex [Prosthecobacter debontii]